MAIHATVDAKQKEKIKDLANRLERRIQFNHRKKVLLEFLSEDVTFLVR